MRVRKVSAAVLAPRSASSANSPRESKRIRLEAKLESVIDDALSGDGQVVYRVLPEDEKPATLRLAFRRVRDRMRATEVNLRTVGGDMYIGKVPPSGRGRKPKG